MLRPKGGKSMTDQESRLVYKNLDTSYLNLPALLRYLQQRGFSGRVHFEREEYEVDVLMNGENDLNVRQTDLGNSQVLEGDEALGQLLARAGAPGGLVSVFVNVPAEVKPNADKIEDTHPDSMQCPASII